MTYFLPLLVKWEENINLLYASDEAQIGEEFLMGNLAIWKNSLLKKVYNID